MSELFRFETTFETFALEPGIGSVDVTVNLWCGDVLLDQRKPYGFFETDSEIKDAIKGAQESMATTLGNALNDLMRKGGYTS